MSILLVEDDQDLATGLLEALRKEGLSINHVGTAKAALHVIGTETPEIVILDLGLPDKDGLDVLRQLRRQHRDLPVLVLTARDSLGDKVAGLDSGADDYLAKPFEMAELLARLRVLGRRMGTSSSNVISVGAVNLDTTSQTVTVNGEPADLPRREYMLLKVLMENAGRVQTRDSLENKLYSWGEEVASNALEVHIHHLRKKLGSDFIATVRGVGYTVKEA
ncbi:MAG: XRE family transcriptional regulator [Betaproteobacteria bacterium SG8_40]|nr:MAG: XRE family transcriptional regulator [Betaproteobacteria bacterium SG8_40]